jgi:transposase
MFYVTKERLRDMYKSKTKKEAQKQLKLIISALESTDDGELISWGRTLSRWSEYILNYWNSHSTNGFMEGIHNKMKLIKIISFGFRNKKVFIQKVMLSVLITTLLLPQLFT